VLALWTVTRFLFTVFARSGRSVGRAGACVSRASADPSANKDNTMRQAIDRLLGHLILPVLVAAAPLVSQAGPKELTVGALFGMTGSNASYGEQQSRGVQLAFEEINAAGGAGGTMLKLKSEDHGGVAQKGVLALNKLAAVDKVPFVFTSFTNIISATAPIGGKEKIVMLNGGGTAPTLAGLSPYLFSNVPLENYHIRNEAKYAIQKASKKTLGILYVNDALGSADSKVMEESWKELGGQVVDTQAAATDAMDFKAQLTQLWAKKPDAIYIAAGGRQVAAALNQKAELGVTSLILGTSFWTVPEVIQSAKGASEGVIFSTQQWDPERPASEDAKKFVEQFNSKFGSKPLGNSAAYYVGAHILGDVVTALNKADKPITGPNIRDELLKHGDFKTIFGPLKFAPDGTSSMPLTLMTVKDGAFVPVTGQ
jgi:ABC-type branched-subunit amino acid transport system substrate-binding protein